MNSCSRHFLSGILTASSACHSFTAIPRESQPAMGSKKKQRDAVTSEKAREAANPPTRSETRSQSSTIAQVTSRRVRPDDSISSSSAFIFFLLPHVLSAVTSPIQDCDEVFNYWEAAHLLNHNYGFQTWEYSPAYGIRSWAYAAFHAAIIAPFQLFEKPLGGKTGEFFFTRFVLGFACAICETRLFQTITTTTSPRIALLFLLIITTSSGMFHAATAFLPSSFAMYTAMIGATEFMAWRESKHVSRGIFWFAQGAILGWPFAGALILPFLITEALAALSSGDSATLVRQCIIGGIRSLLVLVGYLLSMNEDPELIFIKRSGRLSWTRTFTARS